MERLLEDAGKLANTKFDISKYGDVIQAIHTIQENLGITGTTAKEAADTIEGSMNSTKAAIDNLIVGFARSDADIDKLMGDVETNITNLAKNAIPVAERAFVTMTKTAINAGKEIAERLPKLINQAVTDIHKMIATSFGDSKDKIFAVETAVKSLTAAFITFKATTYLADVVDSIKKVNAALQTGVTLTEALNAANLANPWVIAATAAIGFATAMKSVWDIQTDLIDEAVNGLDRLDDVQRKVYDSIVDTTKEAKESRKVWQEQSETLNSNAVMYAKLSDELFKLDAQEQLSNEDKARMKSIVDSLNGSIEGLNISLNEQNGHLETQKKDIEAVIKAYNDQAKATATQERLVKLYEQQYKLEDKYDEAYKNHAKALKEVNELEGKRINNQKKIDEFFKAHTTNQEIWTKENKEEYNKLFNEQRRLNEELEKASDRSAAFATAYSAVGDEVRSNTDEINKNVQNLANMGQEYDEVTASIVANADTTAEKLEAIRNAAEKQYEGVEGFWLNIRDETRVLSLETAEEVGKLIDTYDELYNAQYESIAKSVDLYKGFEADTSVTYNDLLNNLKQSEFYLNDWTTAIDQLQTKVNKGLMSQQFLDSLKNMGLDSWNIVYNMNHATEGQLKEYSDLWVKTNNGIKESTDKLTADQKESAEKQIAEITGIAGASMEEYKKAFSDVGVAIGDGLVDGIHSKIKEAQAEIKEMGEGVIQIGKETLKVNSPSEEFREIGNYIVEGLVLGINEKTSLAEEAVRDLAKKTVLTLEKEMQIGSPSKVMKELGRYTSEGYAIGIEDNAKEVYSAMKSISENAQNVIDTDKIDLVGTRKIRSISKRSDEGETTFSGLSIRTLTEAFKEAITDLVSGDIVVEGTLDGEKLLEVIFPKIDAMQGKRAEAAIRGYAT